MKILIISGSGDYTAYIQYQGIGLNFYRMGTILDTTHYSKLELELEESYQAAKRDNKGLCFSTQRYEIINKIYDYFKEDNDIEFIRVEKDNSVAVYDKYSLGTALNYQKEIR